MLAKWFISPMLLPGFYSFIKRLRVFVLPLDGMLVHYKVTPSVKFAVYVYPLKHLSGERHCGESQCPRPGLEPWPLDYGSA